MEHAGQRASGRLGRSQTTQGNQGSPCHRLPQATAGAARHSRQRLDEHCFRGDLRPRATGLADGRTASAAKNAHARLNVCKMLVWCTWRRESVFVLRPSPAVVIVKCVEAAALWVEALLLAGAVANHEHTPTDAGSRVTQRVENATPIRACCYLSPSPWHRELETHSWHHAGAPWTRW